MRRIHIRDKLKELNFDLGRLSLGEFDEIGELAAKKKRDKSNPLYHTAGAYFRPNYERGLLLYALVTTMGIRSYLETGFGRGYSALCVAKAMTENNIPGEIITIDINFNQQHLENLYQNYPKEWFDLIKFVQGNSRELLPQINGDFDLIYIDGDHSYNGVKADWDWAKNHFTKAVLFDDYDARQSMGDELECRVLIDQINMPQKDLLIQDRRIFVDDRRIPDDEMQYGQVLITKGGIPGPH